MLFYILFVVIEIKPTTVCVGASTVDLAACQFMEIRKDCHSREKP